MLARQLAAARQIATVGLDLVRRRYPAALYRRPATAEELPTVFCFHSAQPAPFEAVLQFLARNGYRTLTSDEYHARLRGAGNPAERAVLLTFDDGLGQVWSVAWPLLRKYGMRATCFVIPGRVQEQPAGARHPNLDDVWAGRATLAEVSTRDQSAQPLATWTELAAMHASGVIDIQCHSFDHRLVVTSPRIVDFVSPAALARFHPFEFSMFRDEDGTTGVFERPALGSPIYTSAPRLAEGLRYRPDPALAARCVEHVAAHGGAAFFERPDWRRTLFALTRRHVGGDAGAYETEDERRAVIALDLQRAKALLEARLPGARIRHLAWPWGEGSAAAIEAARAAGYRGCFWNKVDGRLVNRVGGDPFRLARIGEDFACSLLGAGRVPLRQVMRRKLESRLRQPSPYLSH
jgi:Polysaccharide deacetylase